MISIMSVNLSSKVFIYLMRAKAMLQDEEIVHISVCTMKTGSSCEGLVLHKGELTSQRMGKV